MATSGSATRGFVWKALEQFGLMGAQFGLQVILARIIAPEAYGVIAIASIFISFSNIVIQCGLGTALVQKEEITDTQVSSIFNFSLLSGAAVYALLFFAAPAIGEFFKMEELTSILRVMMLCIFPGLFNSVQIALIRRRLYFKANFISSLISISLGGAVGVWSAMRGAGAWALVWQQLVYTLTVSLSLSFAVRWLPRPVMKLREISSMIAYGWKVLCSSLIDEFVVNLRTFVIGKKFDMASLAYFARGRSFPDLAMRSINGSLEAVLLPVLAREQNDLIRVRELMRRSVSVSTFLIYPVLVLLAAAAPTYIPWLLTDKWLPAVFYLQVFCVYFACWPLTTNSRQALYARGESGVVLRLDVIRKTLDVCVLFISMYWGMKGIAYGVAAVSIISILIYLAPAGKYLNYSMLDQTTDTLPNLITALAAGVPVYLLNMWKIAPGLLLLCQTGVWGAVYLLLSALFSRRSLRLTSGYVGSLLRHQK